MPAVKMKIDDNLLKKTRKIAIDRDTTAPEMFRDYLSDLARREEARREFLADELDRLFAASCAASHGQLPMKDELHERLTFVLGFTNCCTNCCRQPSSCGNKSVIFRDIR